MQRSNDCRLRIKKTLVHPSADEERRRDFLQTIETHEAQGRNIVYLDESGFALDMPRTHGYSARGTRCYGTKDWHARGRVNVIGAMTSNTLLTVTVFDCYVDSDVFFAWLTQDLIPKLPPQSVVVMDNASFHKRQDMIDAFVHAGHTSLFLPPYSPDLNPIEHKWAQAKAKRKKLRCTVSELFNTPF